MIACRRIYPAEQKRTFVEAVERLVESERIPIYQACHRVGIRWQSYYSWRKRIESQPQRPQDLPLLVSQQSRDLSPFSILVGADQCT